MKLTTVQRESFEHLTLDNCHWYSFLRLAWFGYLLVLLCSFYLSIKNQFLSELILAVFTVFVVSCINEKTKWYTVVYISRFRRTSLVDLFPRIMEAPAANSATVNARRRKLPTGIINYSDENCMLWLILFHIGHLTLREKNCHT